MPQLIDFNPLIIGSVHIATKMQLEGMNLNPDMGSGPSMKMVRHLALNTLIEYNAKFRAKYGDPIICFDTGISWRKKEFPYYKAKRKEIKADSPLDWDFVYECLSLLEKEMIEYLPYKCVGVDTAEADDVIAVLTKEFSTNEDLFVDGYLFREPQPIMIISADHDFKQLQIFQNVDQYSPLLKKPVRENRPDLYLKEHIIRGDKGDGVPNFLSPDDSFVSGIRQKSIMQVKLDVWVEEESLDNVCATEQIRKNYERNRQMVDLLNCIPKDLVEEILHTYNGDQNTSRSGLFKYCMKYKLKNIQAQIKHL
jgi:5'-3' exonuclease